LINFKTCQPLRSFLRRDAPFFLEIRAYYRKKPARLDTKNPRKFKATFKVNQLHIAN